MKRAFAILCVLIVVLAMSGTAFAGRVDVGFNAAHLRAINKERESRGLAPLSMSKKMNRAAAIRAEELTRLYSHTRPDGTECFTALVEIDSSFSQTTMGENIAEGYPTVSDVMKGWMNSSGHRANILHKEFSRVGVATYVDNNDRCYWVQMFAGSAPDSPYYGEDDRDNGGDGGYREDGTTGCSNGFGAIALLSAGMFFRRMKQKI